VLAVWWSHKSWMGLLTIDVGSREKAARGTITRLATSAARVKAPKGFKRQIAKSSRFAPQWRYVSLCLSSIRFMSKKRYGAQSNAHKSRMKRYEVRSSKMGGLFGLLNQPQGIPLSSLSPPKPKTASDPNALAPFGLLSGLLPYFDKEEKK
jgi:hypothetical protein